MRSKPRVVSQARGILAYGRNYAGSLMTRK